MNVTEKKMKVHFNCYLEGRKATKELMADKDYHTKILKANRAYYLAMGCCLNFIQSRMVDAIGNICEKGLYRREIKYACRKATEEMNRLMRQIKDAIVGGQVFDGDDYQFWMDVVDAMEKRFAPKIDRLQTVMRAYLKKFDFKDVDFASSICVVSALLHYMKGTVYQEIREDRLENILIDIDEIFVDGDGKNVLKWWVKVEDLVIPTDKLIDFDNSKSCHRALESFVIMFCKPATFRMPLRYAKEQRALRHPEVDWKAMEKEIKRKENKEYART